MRKSIMIYVGIIYLLSIIEFVTFYEGISYPQLMIMIGFIFLTVMFNLDVLKDMQANVTYFFALPFVIPAFVYLNPFYAMLYIYLAAIFIYRNSKWYKIIFNASSYSIAIGISSFLFQKIFPDFINSPNIFSTPFFIAIILLTFYYKISNYLLVFTVVSLEKRKFDINVIIGVLNTTKSAFVTFFVGLTNVVLFFYTNMIGVAIFSFIVFFFKPALRFRQIFDNELSTFTSFVLHIINQMDPITHSHSERVKFWTIILAEKKGFSSTEIRQLSQAASWHDIGKIEIPDSILNKPSELTKNEHDIVKLHPEQGYQLVKDLEFFKKFLPVIRHHHERYDGTGYPLGLKGNEIPLHARIMTITDAFDAMTSDRSYRKAIGMKEAVEELIRCSGTQFDPNLVQTFVEALQDKYGKYYENFNLIILKNVE